MISVLPRSAPTPAAAAVGRENLFGLRLGDLVVVRELHRVDSAPLTHGPEGRGIAEHLTERNAGADHSGSRALGHPAHLPTAGGEVPDDVAHVVGWGHYFHVHD